ncbi:MAG: VWA domain-containing protein [Bryobacteraceae bacterium]
MAILLLSLMICTIMIPMIGLAFDLTIMYIVKAKLSAAVDSAVLAGGRSLVGSETLAAQQSQVTNIALDFLNANMPQGYWGTLATPTVLTPTANIVTQDNTNAHILISLKATVQVPTAFMQYLQPTVTVAASGQAMRRFLRLVIVIDKSGSMVDTEAELTAAVSNTSPSNPGFVQDFFEGSDQLGLVVFNSSALVAYPPRNPANPASGGGPNANFKTINTPNIPGEVATIKAVGDTGTAQALVLAYQELAKTPQPLYYNVIVLFTDGMPNTIMGGWNGAAPPALFSGDPQITATPTTTILTTSHCTYKKYTDFTAGNQMVGWYGPQGGLFVDMNTKAYNGTTGGTTADVEGWLADTTYWPGPYGANTTGCSFTSTYPTQAYRDVNNFPAGDLYGDNLNVTDYQLGLQYHNNGIALSATDVSDPGNEGWLLGWNAVNRAGNRIRSDSTLKPTIYCIGYTGNGGVDHALLKRLTNTSQGFTANTWSTSSGGDPSGPYPSSAYIPGQTSGMYYDAGPGGIAAAFQQVRSQILSLAM